jgi:hypothetical protein
VTALAVSMRAPRENSRIVAPTRRQCQRLDDSHHTSAVTWTYSRGNSTSSVFVEFLEVPLNLVVHFTWIIIVTVIIKNVFRKSLQKNGR